MKNPYAERMNGLKVLVSGRSGISGSDPNDIRQTLKHFGAILVDSATEADVVATSKLTKKVEKEIAKANSQPQVLLDDAVLDWFLPSNEEFAQILSAKDLDLEALEYLLVRLNSHTREKSVYSGIDMQGVSNHPRLTFDRHTIEDSRFTDCSFCEARFDTLRNCTLQNVETQQGCNTKHLEGTTFDGFRGSIESYQSAKGCTFTNCHVQYLHIKTSQTRFLNTHISQGRNNHFDDCDLERTSFGPKDGRHPHLAEQLNDFRFHSCRAIGLQVDRCTFDETSHFTESQLQKAVFSDCTFVGSQFVNCDLSGADFRGVVFIDASFKGCNLSDAMFDGAVIWNTDFTGATLEGASFAGTRIGATELQADGLEDISRIAWSPNADTQAFLDDLAVCSIAIFKPDNTCFGLRIRREQQGTNHFWKFTVTKPVEQVPDPSDFHPFSLLNREFKAPDLDTAITWLRLFARGQGAIEPKRITARSNQGENHTAGMIAAYDILEEDPAPIAPLIAERKAKQEAEAALFAELNELLAGGAAGIKAWNKRKADVQSFNSFANTDLPGQDLRKVNLHGADFSESNWREANLSGAQFGKAILNGSCMAHTDLTGAKARSAKLLAVDFQNANLTDAALAGSELAGADFRGATLDGVAWKNAKFNRTTRWPEGFVIPKDLKFKGRGGDPRNPAKVPDDLLPDTGLVAAVAHATASGIESNDASPGDPAAFHKFLDKIGVPAKRPFAETFATTSLLANSSGEIDSHIRWHNLDQIEQEHTLDLGQELARSGILLIGAADSNQLTYDLLTGEVHLFLGYINCLHNEIEGQGSEQTLYDTETQRDWPLYSEIGQEIMRDLLRKDASKSWPSIGLYAQHIMAKIDESG